MTRTPEPLARSTVKRLREDARRRTPMALFLRRGPGNQPTKTELRWRSAERRGFCQITPWMGGILVTLTPHGEGYLGTSV